jgi:4-amino-4-deoxy-L-arabinose transferase-like glycosyltransferase
MLTATMLEIAGTRPRTNARLTAAVARVDPVRAAIGALTVAAFFLRVSQIHQSLAGDEVWTFLDISGRSFRAVLTTVHTGGENSPPLFFLLAWGSAKLGDPTVLIRLPSLVLGTATVPVVYALGRSSVGRAGGLAGAAVFALAPFTVFYGVEARPYATMTFFVALSTLALLRAVDTRRRAWWLLYALSASAAAYTHYTSIFVLGVQGLWSLWACRRDIRTAVVSNAAIVLLYAPWLPHVRGKALPAIGALYPLTAHHVLADLFRPLLGHPTAPLSAIPTVPGLVVIAACAFAGAWLLIRDAHGSLSLLPRRLPLLVALTLATPVGLLVYSLIATDLWLPRGLSASIPASALVLGTLLTATPPRLKVAGAAAVAVVLLAGTFRSFDAAYTRPPFRSVSVALDRVAKPDDPILVESFFGGPAIGAQLKKPHRFVGGLPMLWSTVPPGGDAYLAIDESTPLAPKGGAPQHAGFHIVSRRLFVGGGFTTALITYRR